jgi:hypothetical protein
MTTTGSGAGPRTPQGPKHAARDTLPFRAPGAQGPPIPVPSWRPGASGRAEPEPETMRRVSAALKRL